MRIPVSADAALAVDKSAPSASAGFSRRPKLPRGITMVELMISAAIGVLILIALYNTFSMSLGSFVKGSGRLEAVRTARTVMERLRRDISEGVDLFKAFQPSGIAGTGMRGLMFNKYVYDAATGVPSLGTDSSPVTEDIRYERSGSAPYKLLRYAPGGSIRRIADNIEDIAFSIYHITLKGGSEKKFTAVRIELTLKLDGKNAFGTTETFRTTVVPRCEAAWARQPNWVRNFTGNTLVITHN